MRQDGPWRQCRLPGNLTDWVGEALLIRLVLNAVDSVEDSRMEGARLGGETPLLTPRVTLTLLVYACAAGIRGSHEIAERLRHDATLRYLTIGRNPGADALRRFRNRNREVIAGCLGRVFCAAGRMRRASRGAVPAWPGRLGGRRLGCFEKLMELQCLCEARQRLTQAEIADGLWVDTSAAARG